MFRYANNMIEALYYENILDTIYMIVDGTDHSPITFQNI